MKVHASSYFPITPNFETLLSGTQAPMVGTLMKIVSARRNEDSTLALVVQVPPYSAFREGSSLLGR